MIEKENILTLFERKDNNVELLSIIKILIDNANFSFIHDTNVIREIWEDRLVIAEILDKNPNYNDGLLTTVNNLRLFNLDKVRVSDCNFDKTKCLIFTDEYISVVIGIIFFPPASQDL